MNKTLTITLVALFITSTFFGQKKDTFKIHSHNDYLRETPFWEAYANKVASIEIDVILQNDTLFVAHEVETIHKRKTIGSLYLKPLTLAFSIDVKDRRDIQLLIDFKNTPYASLDKLIQVLQEYQHLLKTPQKRGITIVISGSRPAVKDYVNYPNYITFDYQKLENIPEAAWEKVGLISLSFSAISQWNGKGRLLEKDLNKVKYIVSKAHAYGKPFRFWGTPDSKTAWKVFTDLGVDYINTDMVYKATQYLKNLGNRVYQHPKKTEIYLPTFKWDQKKKKVKNVILLIGDGNGLSQISAALLANKGQLTLTQLKSIGFIKTQSADDFTTDSAAGATAFATGEMSNNRAIGVSPKGEPLKNITEILATHNFISACISSGDVTGATPASFYAHQKDRSNTLSIADDLLNSKLSLFIGGGKEDFENDFSKSDFRLLNTIAEVGDSKIEKVGFFISEEGVTGVLEGRGNILAEATKNGLQFLKSKNKPFFIMVEGAQIDWNGHLNNVAGIVSEGIDFDMAVAEAIKFADNNKNTLVIITADHETSGFSIPQGNVAKGIIEGDFTTYDHTGEMVPVFAYGPHSQDFQGVYKNKEIFHKIMKVLKIKP